VNGVTAYSNVRADGSELLVIGSDGSRLGHIVDGVRSDAAGEAAPVAAPVEPPHDARVAAPNVAAVQTPERTTEESVAVPVPAPDVKPRVPGYVDEAAKQLAQKVWSRGELR
jgi:hypothetical protein